MASFGSERDTASRRLPRVVLYSEHDATQLFIGTLEQADRLDSVQTRDWTRVCQTGGDAKEQLRLVYADELNL